MSEDQNKDQGSYTFSFMHSLCSVCIFDDQRNTLLRGFHTVAENLQRFLLRTYNCVPSSTSTLPEHSFPQDFIRKYD